MKVRTLILCSTTLACVLMLCCCGPGKYVAKPNEEIYGTWINEKADAQKLVIGPEGGKMYLKVNDTDVYAETTGEIVSKWIDSEGNIWYKSSNARSKGAYAGMKFTELDKLSKSGTVWESVWIMPSNDEQMKNPKYPNKIDPQDPNYEIYYRAKE